MDRPNPDRVTVAPITALEAHAGTRTVGRSDVGRSRDENQDFMGFFRAPDRLLVVVCDGMGGHSGGYEASRIAVDAMRQTFVSHPEQEPASVLLDGVAHAHARVRQVAAAAPDLAGMGTTLVAAVITPGQAFIAHVGDSRAYLVRSGVAILLTLDHSRVNRMLIEGMITPDQVANHPMGHILERSVGSSGEVDAEVRPTPVALQKGDRLLLCSDGVWSVVSDADLSVLASGASLPLAAEAVLGAALVRLTDDNATVILTEAEGGLSSAPDVVDVRRAVGLTPLVPAPAVAPPTPAPAAPAPVEARRNPPPPPSSGLRSILIAAVALSFGLVAGAVLALGAERALDIAGRQPDDPSVTDTPAPGPPAETDAVPEVGASRPAAAPPDVAPVAAVVPAETGTLKISGATGYTQARVRCSRPGEWTTLTRGAASFAKVPTTGDCSVQFKKGNKPLTATGVRGGRSYTCRVTTKSASCTEDGPREVAQAIPEAVPVAIPVAVPKVDPKAAPKAPAPTEPASPPKPAAPVEPDPAKVNDIPPS